jgi:hypothetical protein
MYELDFCHVALFRAKSPGDNTKIKVIAVFQRAVMKSFTRMTRESGSLSKCAIPHNR